MPVSSVVQCGRVVFPTFRGERIYMQEFTKAAGLPRELRHWQDTVNAMLDGVDAPGKIFLMVDQAPVRAAQTHRRGGVHVDGAWNPALYAHGHGRLDRDGMQREGLILASDVLGCAAYVGAFEGEPGSGGDCSHIEVGGLQRVEMEAGRAWAGNTMDMLHESIPMRSDGVRTVVRLNVPGWGI